MDENKSTKTRSAWGKKAGQSQGRKASSPSLSGLFIEFSLHKDVYKRKEVWFTDNISEIRGVLSSQGLVDRVMSISCKILGHKLILCLDP